jgi:hypothetical protein
VLGSCFNDCWAVLTYFVRIVDFNFIAGSKNCPVFRVSEKIQVVFSINDSHKILNHRFSATVFTSHSHKLWLCVQQEMKHQMGGATHAQQGMTFKISFIYSFTIRIGHFSNCENRSSFKLDSRLSQWGSLVGVRTAQHWFQPLIPVFGLF